MAHTQRRRCLFRGACCKPRCDLAAHKRRLAPLSSVIDRILVINLNSRRDRKLQISKELKRHVSGTFKVKRIAGEVGKTQDFEILVWQGKLTHMGYESVLRKRVVSGHYLTAGAIGCLLSHKKAWERTVISGGTSLVLEDDVLLLSQFGIRANSHERTAGRFWTALSRGQSANSRRDLELTNILRSFISKDWKLLGHVCVRDKRECGIRLAPRDLPSQRSSGLLCTASGSHVQPGSIPSQGKLGGHGQ